MAGCRGIAARALCTAVTQGSGPEQPQRPMRGLALAVTAALAGGSLWVSAEDCACVAAAESCGGKTLQLCCRCGCADAASA